MPKCEIYKWGYHYSNGHPACTGEHVGLNIFIHISIYSNIQIYILQYNHVVIQNKVMRLIRICFPLNIMVHSFKLYQVEINKNMSCIQTK